MMPQPAILPSQCGSFGPLCDRFLDCTRRGHLGFPRDCLLVASWSSSWLPPGCLPTLFAVAFWSSTRLSPSMVDLEPCERVARWRKTLYSSYNLWAQGMLVIHGLWRCPLLTNMVTLPVSPMHPPMGARFLSMSARSLPELCNNSSPWMHWRICGGLLQCPHPQEPY